MPCTTFPAGRKGPRPRSPQRPETGCIANTDAGRTADDEAPGCRRMKGRHRAASPGGADTLSRRPSATGGERTGAHRDRGGRNIVRGAAWTDGRHRLKSPSDGFPANQACPALDGSVPLASCPESRAWARRSLQPRHSTCLRGHWCLHPGSRWSVRGRPARSGFVRSFHDRWPLGTDTSSAAHS